MTVPSTEYKAGPFVCDGTQTEFPFHFPVLDKDHIEVWKDGVPVIIGYAVVLSGSTGGTVIFTEAPENGSRVAIIRAVPINQLTDIQNNTAFLPEVLETEYDKGTMIDQMLAEALSRCLKVSPTDDAIDFSAFVKEMREAVALAKRYADEAKRYAELVGKGSISVDESLNSFIEVGEDDNGAPTLTLANRGGDYTLVVAVQNGYATLLDTTSCAAEIPPVEV